MTYMQTLVPSHQDIILYILKGGFHFIFCCWVSKFLVRATLPWLLKDFYEYIKQRSEFNGEFNPMMFYNKNPPPYKLIILPA